MEKFSRIHDHNIQPVSKAAGFRVFLLESFEEEDHKAGSRQDPPSCAAVGAFAAQPTQEQIYAERRRPHKSQVHPQYLGEDTHGNPKFTKEAGEL